MTFANFDTRGYPTVDVRTGYARWVPTYEDTVCDVMDLALFDRVDVDWAGASRALDLGCGTGRTGRYLRSKGVRALDGVDLTPEMLAVARSRGAHDRLVEGDVRDTGLESGAYDLLVASLIDEHLEDLRPFYAEAKRLAAPGATCAVVAFHPHWIMATGMPTHFRGEDGTDVAITTHVHMIGEHQMAALAAGWRLAEIHEGVVDDAWLAVKPKWVRHLGHPVSYVQVWRC